MSFDSIRSMTANKSKKKNKPRFVQIMWVLFYDQFKQTFFSDEWAKRYFDVFVEVNNRYRIRIYMLHKQMN